MGERRLLSLVGKERLRRILKVMLDESEFLSPYGIRAVSRYHLENPYILHANGDVHRVDYEPAESSTGLFGGNSNWRGPIWFPVNDLLIESLEKFHHYLAATTKWNSRMARAKMTRLERAAELSSRLTDLSSRRQRPRPSMAD